MKAYKFLRDDMRSGYGDESAWKEGKKRTVRGELELCKRGYHSCPNWYDALSYAKGNIACIVEVSRPTEKSKDKQVSHSCTIIKARNAEKVLRAWGCDCAERALTAAGVTDERSWNAIKVTRLYSEGKATKEELAAAGAAAGAAAERATWDAAGAAAGAAAQRAAWDAAGDAARRAAWDAARDAARDWDTARTAEIKWQQQHLDELMGKLFEEG